MSWLKDLWYFIVGPKRDWYSELMKLELVGETEIQTLENKKGDVMAWFMMIMQLLPYIVAGIHAVHPTATHETKSQIVTNLINIAATGVINTGVVTGQNAELAAVAANTATALLSATAPVVPAGDVPPPAVPGAPVTTATTTTTATV